MYVTQQFFLSSYMYLTVYRSPCIKILWSLLSVYPSPMVSVSCKPQVYSPASWTILTLFNVRLTEYWELITLLLLSIIMLSPLPSLEKDSLILVISVDPTHTNWKDDTSTLIVKVQVIRTFSPYWSITSSCSFVDKEKTRRERKRRRMCTLIFYKNNYSCVSVNWKTN